MKKRSNWIRRLLPSLAIAGTVASPIIPTDTADAQTSIYNRTLQDTDRGKAITDFLAREEKAIEENDGKFLSAAAFQALYDKTYIKYKPFVREYLQSIGVEIDYDRAVKKGDDYSYRERQEKRQPPVSRESAKRALQINNLINQFKDSDYAHYNNHASTRDSSTVYEKEDVRPALKIFFERGGKLTVEDIEAVFSPKQLQIIVDFQNWQKRKEKQRSSRKESSGVDEGDKSTSGQGEWAESVASGGKNTGFRPEANHHKRFGPLRGQSTRNI